jgi:multiple sugar transport system ATP-binding protein
MDEPLSNLDAKLRVQMRAEISRLQRELGATTIYVTHDQVEAMTMGDRVAVMRRGELQQCDAPQTLYNAPANLFVASFIGSPAMNFVEADVSRGPRGFVCTVGDSKLVLPEATASLAGYEGRTVALGVRPEHLGPADSESHLRLRGKVVLTEALGPALLVHVDVSCRPVTIGDVLEGLVDGDPSDASPLVPIRGSGARLIASFDADHRVAIGDSVELGLDRRRLHFFDLDGGQAIRAGDSTLPVVT